MNKGHNSKNMSAERLESFIKVIEKLNTEKEAISGQITEFFAQAKGEGFDPKTMRAIIKLRKLTAEERDQEEALLDIYKAALGMLGDTPLGEAAIRRLSKKDEQQEEEGNESPEPEQTEKADDGITIDQAKEMGRKDYLEGKPVTANPFPARDPRRAAWDEEWCRASGTDGMELPNSWKRSPKKKDDEDKGEE